MTFQLDEQNLQFVISSFTINNILDTVLETEIIQIPVNHFLIRELSGFELTTTLLFAIIPELFYNYGHRNVSLGIKPLTGTTVSWNRADNSTNLHVRALTTWIVDEDAFDNKTVEVFDSVLDLDVKVAFSINATKFLAIHIDELQLSGFNVTIDNLNGSIKGDESGIKYRLQGILSTIEVVINSIFDNFHIQLPEMKVFDYSIKFQNQDGAFGTGIMVSRK